MLVLKRKPGQEVHLIQPGTGVIERFKILSVVYGSDGKPVVRVGIDAPKDTQIIREELRRNSTESDQPNESST
jgi:sRNA-binding carbon storage regulator CsrA